MKMIIIGKTMYSLENVRCIEQKEITSSKHTSSGRKYELYHSMIIIDYTDGGCKSIPFNDFGCKKTLETTMQTTFVNIIDILQK